MITRTQGIQIYICIFCLSLTWCIGKRESLAPATLEEGTQMTFSFSLPSMSQFLGPTGKTDLFTQEPVHKFKFVSLYDGGVEHSELMSPVETAGVWKWQRPYSNGKIKICTTDYYPSGNIKSEFYAKGKMGFNNSSQSIKNLNSIQYQD